jgi:DNA primase large subunit
MPDLYILAKYPFLQSSIEYIKSYGPSVEELLESYLYERARALGARRVKEALELNEIREHDLSTEASQLMELLSYPFARILVSCLGDRYLIKRYALAEGLGAYRKMLEESSEFLELVAKELGAELTRTNDDFKVHFVTYLRYSFYLRGSDWKLVNRELDSGWVNLQKKDLARLLQEMIRAKIEQELPLNIGRELKELIRDYLKELELEYMQRKKFALPKTVGKVTSLKFPPCIRHLLALIENNENVPHSGRFALTAFLHAVGVSSEDILKVFSTMADFDEKKTLYQIEHITGRISGTVYTPPECRTMKTYGLCYGEDELCKKSWVTHPLKYYRFKQKPTRKFD